MDVSIILVNYKTKELTINCIKSIQEKTKDLKYEIILVDNASNDGSIETIEKKYPNIKIIKNDTNLGFGIANNIGIKNSNGKYILCLNTDTILINNAIKLMYDFMEKSANQKIGACGGNLMHVDMTPAHTGFSFPNVWNCSSLFWINKFLFKQYYAPKEIKSVVDIDFITGADLFIRKSVLDDIGYYDENIFMYYEDVDLCLRMKKAGYRRVLIPEPQIIHLEGQSSKNFLKKTKNSVKGKYYYLNKHKLYLSKIVMKISYMVIHMFAFIFTKNKDHYDLIKIHCLG